MGTGYAKGPEVGAANGTAEKGFPIRRDVSRGEFLEFSRQMQKLLPIKGHCQRPVDSRW
jgi:hypothetical protein